MEAESKVKQQLTANSKYDRKTDAGKWFVVAFVKTSQKFEESSFVVTENTVSFTKPFQVFAYDDGTMPFAKDVQDDAAKKLGISANRYLLGAYSSKEEAEQAVANLPSFLLHDYIKIDGTRPVYTRQKGNTNSTDFWENGNKATPKQNKPKTNNENFWND